jgi:hypothetical protein
MFFKVSCPPDLFNSTNTMNALCQISENGLMLISAQAMKTFNIVYNYYYNFTITVFPEYNTTIRDSVTI